MTERLIIRGRNYDYDIDALICGTTDNYAWIMKYNIYELVLSKICLDFTFTHIACMTIGSKNRNLGKISKNYKYRYLVCIRWNFIKENIIKFKNSMKESIT